ncbi:MAG: TetR/AcrR family transcriptional regulator [Chloroflexi bacterium]|nr:TetR/AcrR family transcriptional regulator [Chloroflexota bacterium]
MSISKSASYHHGNLRQALIDAAVGALQTEGIEALSLRKLAKDIGVSHNAPYMHFEDKEALLAAIAEEGFKRLAEAIEGAFEQAGAGWTERFQGGCTAYVGFMVEHSAYAQVMFRTYDSAKNPSFSTAAAAALHLLEVLIQEGQAAGHVAPGNSRRWTILTWSLLHGVSTLFGASGHSLPPLGQITPEELTRRSIESLYLGLKPRG